MCILSDKVRECRIILETRRKVSVFIRNHRGGLCNFSFFNEEENNERGFCIY